MPLGVRERCPEKCGDKLRGQEWPDDACPQAKDIHVIVLHALTGRKGVVAQCGPDPPPLAGGNARPDAASAKKDSSLGIARLNGLPDPLSENRIVVRGVQGGRAEIQDLVARQGNCLGYRLPQGVATMVGSKCDFHIGRW